MAAGRWGTESTLLSIVEARWSSCTRPQATAVGRDHYRDIQEAWSPRRHPILDEAPLPLLELTDKMILEPPWRGAISSSPRRMGFVRADPGAI